MRNILICGSLFVACLGWCAAAQAADDLAEQSVATDAAESSAEPTGEDSLLYDSAAGCACCDCLDCDCYDCCDMFNGRRRVLGFLPSDHCFDRFVSPLSNPFFFEDPRSLTEVRGIFIDNSLPSDVGQGDAQVFAGQLRGRVTDRVSLIAQRLAHFQVNDGDPDKTNGLMSAPVGFKVNLIRDVERQFLVSAGITYFIKGSGNAASNFGDGDFHFFLTGGKQIFDRGHWLSGTGFRIPASYNWGTQMWYWSNQWDYEIVDHIYPLVGLNWFHWMSSSPLPTGIPFTGLDFVDLPSNGVAGTNVVTGMAGVKWKPSSHCEVGSGFEFPLTNRTDILRNRLYVDLILRY